MTLNDDLREQIARQQKVINNLHADLKIAIDRPYFDEMAHDAARENALDDYDDSGYREGEAIREAQFRTPKNL